MKKFLTFILVLVIIAAVALPKVIGSQGRKIHNNYFQAQAKQVFPGITIESEKMDDGWFSSEGQHRVKLSEAMIRKMFPMIKDIKLKKEVDLLVDTRFHHGPFAFTALGSKGSSFSPVMAVSESTFALETSKGQVELPGKLFTQVDTLGDGGKAIYVIDEYRHQTDDATINFDGLNIEFDIDDKGRVVDSEGEAGTLSIKGKRGGEVLLTGMDFDADMEKEHGLWFGDSNFRFDKIKFSDEKGVNFSISDINLKGGNDGNGDAFDSEASFSIGEFVVSDMKFEDFTLEYEIENVDTQAAAKIQEASRGSKMMGQATVLKELKNIVERSPKLVVKELSLKTPGGKIHADLDLGLPDEIDMTFFPYSLPTQLEGQGLIRIPKGVIPVLESVQPGLGARLDFLIQTGIFEEKGGDYIAKLRLQEWNLTVNGEPLPLPGLF